ncbi:MAG: transglutaminase family protein [Labilithrix sp.]|nr:transglutaminase family protein [Labilithrix sp.]MCW5810213.1 transglutaminase family protein [Labilithrix sp.]
MSAPDPSLLEPGVYVDSDHPDVVAFARAAVGDAASDAEKTARLFRAVRERIRYDPYTLSFDPRDMMASNVLKKERAYCIPKAVLFAAAARASGLPARLGFADVKNHLSSPKLIATLGSDLFAYHGFVEVWVDGAPYKLTPAFNSALCERFGVATLDFDPSAPSDALFQPYDRAGNRYMEYVADRGLHHDLPFSEILGTFAKLYPGFRAIADDAFHG